MGKLFEDLLESVTQMDEILRGERTPCREFRVDALRVREIRLATGLSQARFARVLDAHVGTLSRARCSDHVKRVTQRHKHRRLTSPSSPAPSPPPS